MSFRIAKLTALVALVALAGCSKKEADGDNAAETATAEPVQEADHIAVQHILIGFVGSVPGKNITRTQEEAGKLAGDILKRAQDGEDFDALVREYTDDAYPGIYRMANKGVAADQAKREFPREQMVPAFGDVGFPLAVGGIGMADYNQATSPYGWHIIKRVE